MRSFHIGLKGPSLVFMAAVMALALFVPAVSQASSHVRPSGITEGEASQIIAWYDESGTDPQNGHSFFQITVGAASSGVNIHVQIYAQSANDPDGDCREVNFNDSLTPGDTVLYALGGVAANSGGAVPIGVGGTRGFIVVTPVDKLTIPRRAIAFNHMFGTMRITGADDMASDEVAHRVNAMGRPAVDFATGELLPDGTILDGVTTGFALLQPELLSFNYGGLGSGDFASIVSIAFADNYSDSGGEYRAVPSTATWNPFIFNEFEGASSCRQHTNSCFVSLGLSSRFDSVADPGGALLCPGGGSSVGWVKIAVSGLTGLDNALGVTGFVVFDGSFSLAGASWMVGR